MRSKLIIVLIFALAGVLAAQSLPAPVDAAQQPRAYVYREIDGQKFNVYVFLPPGEKSGKPTSAILLFHGGGWVQGSAEWTFDDARRFAALGMAAFAFDYRLSQGTTTPIEAVDDTRSAFRWVRRHAADFNIDPKRVAGHGVSAGGHLVAAAATIDLPGDRIENANSKPDLLLLWSPPLDVSAVDYFVKLLQGRASGSDYSPIEHAGASTPPTSVVNGEKDIFCTLSSAERFRDRIIQSGGVCELNVYPGVGHLLNRKLADQEKEFDPDPRFTADGRARQDRFLREHGYIQDIENIPYLPLVDEVLFPPSPVKGAGGIHLIYELHLSNFHRGPLTLRSVEALGDGKTLIKTYQGDKLSECLVRPGKPPDMKDKYILDGGTRAVLFVMLSFGKSSEVPNFLTHRVTVEYSRSGGEKVLMQGEGARVSILGKAPLMIGPPVRPGVWLAGNCPGDGPVGHRLSMQPWNGRLVVNERYAIDFMKFGDDCRLVHGASSSNSNWHSYGEEVIAVADGVISAIKEGVIENTPLGPYAVSNSLDYAAGNYVILNIGHDVYAVYAHLKPKSLRVKVGDKVQKGQVLGWIGNSGISDAPHLHFHMIDSNSVFGGEGIPYAFEQFEFMGSFENIDDNLDKRWIPKGGSFMRYDEIPLGEAVIKLVSTAKIPAASPLMLAAGPPIVLDILALLSLV